MHSQALSSLAPCANPGVIQAATTPASPGGTPGQSGGFAAAALAVMGTPAADAKKEAEPLEPIPARITTERGTASKVVGLPSDGPAFRKVCDPAASSNVLTSNLLQRCIGDSPLTEPFLTELN